MLDLVIWVGAGVGALVQLLVWSWFMPGASLSTPPSEYAATIFIILLFGPLALCVISLISVMMIIVGTFLAAGALIDMLFKRH